MYFDTHCHLDYLKKTSPKEVLEKSLEVGVNKMVSISTEPSNLDEVIKIANTYPHSIYCTQGIHPHDAKSYDEQVRLKIIKNTQEHKQVVAIGEIGLDYHYKLSDPLVQKLAFEQQMQIAVDLKKPVVIHTRDAEEDTWAILNNFKSSLKAPLVLHSFTSKIELAHKALSAGFYIGFNGIVTFKNAQNVRDVLDIVPVNKLLLETDAPFLTPVPFRGKENAPFYLPHTAEYIAKYKNIELRAFQELIYKNSIDFFNIDS